MKIPGLIFGFIIGLILMPAGLAGQALPKVSIGLSVFFGHREKSGGSKVHNNGLFIKGGVGLHALQEYTAELGWVHEVYSEKHPQRFVQFQIGPSIRHRTETYLNTRYPPDHQEQTQAWYSAMIYTRLSWFFSLKK